MANLSEIKLNGTTYNVKDAAVPSWAKQSSKPSYTASEVGAIATSAKGAANGVAELDANGKVPSSQLPSYVDDVLEFSAKSSFPTTGETGKIYVDTSNNKTYRWSGSDYVEISASLALGTTSSTAYRGDRGKTAYDHSQKTSGNPHNVTKSDVGLGNVGNFKAVSTVASQGLSDTEKSNARSNIGAGTGNGTYSKPSDGIPKTDLASAVQSSLDKADSAVQTETDPTVPSWAKQTNKPSYTQDEVTDGTTYKRVTSTEKSTWNSKQSALTTTQMSAVNSGIDSTKVGQISTNQTNILLLENMNGAKNLLYVPNGKYTLSSNSNVTVIDGTLTYNSTTSDTTARTLNTITLDAGTYVMMNRQVKPSPTSGSVYGDVRLMSGNTNITTGEPAIFTLDTAQTLKVSAVTYSSLISDMSIKPMIITKAAYDAGFTDYQNYALSNVKITPALIECVDSGSKNLLNYDAWKTVAISNGTAVWENNGVTLTSTAADCYTNYTLSQPITPIPVKQGDVLVMSWDYEITSGVQAEAYMFPNGGSTGAVYALIDAKKLVYTVPSGVTSVTYRVGVRGTGNVAKWKNVMICTKAAFDVSQKFVPYRPSWDAITQKITPTSGTIATSATGITISRYYLTKLNGMAYFSLMANSSSDIAANTIVNVAYVDATSKKSYYGQVIFTASVDSHSEIHANAWLSAGTATQNINFRSDALIPANTNFYITGFYPC